MRRRKDLVKDDSGAATELGYVMTFMLGLVFLSIFTLWTWDLQSARQDTWNEQAMEKNLDSVAQAVERADLASRLDGNATYAEPVPLLLADAGNLQLRMTLDDDRLLIQDRGATLTSSRSISGAAAVTHVGEVELAGLDMVWVVLDGGQIELTASQPGI